MTTRWIFAALALLCHLASAISFAADTSLSNVPGENRDRVLPMAITVNGAESGVWLLVEHNGELYAPSDAFQEWRLILNPDATTINFKGQQYRPLNAVPGFKAKSNLANQSVELQFSPQAFAATRLAGAKAQKLVVNPVLPSVQVNYDLNYSQSRLSKASSVRDMSALSEIDLSSDFGVLTNSISARNLTGEHAFGARRQWRRLETTFTKDLPEFNHTFRIGDSSTRAGMLGRNIYFGGIQYGSNFALTPGYVSQSLPALTGLSAAPSTVELYVNDVLRQVSDIPTGPFAIENLPTITGSGDVRLVVRDQLGRETVIERSFFTHSQLLATGLDDWSVEAGKVRRNLGTASANYGSGFVSGYWRRGINERVTMEGRTAVTARSELLELGGVTALPLQLLGRAAFAGSHDNVLGNGTQSLLGIEHQGLRFGASVELQGASIDYRELGEDPGVLPTKRQLAGNISYATEGQGSFGLGFARIQRYDAPALTTISANYSMRVGRNCDLNFTAGRVQGGTRSNAIGLNLTFFLDQNRISTTSINASDNQTDTYVTYAQNPDEKNKLGWRVLAGRLQNQRHEESGLYYLGPYGNFSGDVSSTPDQTALRLGANGALIYADDHLFAARRSTNSFAVAEIKDYPNIGVGLGGTMLAKTDAAGIALIPNLSAYQSNSIRLNADDLPLNAELDSIERDVVPAWRSGVKVVFPVRSGRGALLKIQLEDGVPAPAGATVQIEGDNEVFYVARRGEVYVTGLKPANHLSLIWKDQRCHFDIALPPEKENEIPRLGPYQCKGITR